MKIRREIMLRLGALSPAAQREAERCRLFLRPLRLSLRAGFLEKREKGRTPSYFISTIQETRIALPALIGPTATRLAYLRG
jgi:hypothetical protein